MSKFNVFNSPHMKLTVIWFKRVHDEGLTGTINWPREDLKL